MAGDHRGKTPLVLLAAGGTGGHLFPAEALSVVLHKRGVAVDLATDHRAAHFEFPARNIYLIPSATVRGRNPFAIARTGALLLAGALKAHALIGCIKPNVVVGFGGYPTVPPILAANWRGVPTLVHEQNGVIGRANRLLASRVMFIATGFRTIKNLTPNLQTKAIFTGNPVRSQVISAAATPYIAPRREDRFNLLVFGGSQGARVMAEIVPAALERLGTDLRARLSIVQQARTEDVEAVSATYARLGVMAQCASFFTDLPQHMARAHLVISRSGASTVAELAVIGRPAILVPLPHALDQDQLANAGALETAGGAITILQAEFTPDRLAAKIATFMERPQQLTSMAAAAKSAGMLEATEQLAELVMRVGRL
jgi:UDP-N-acetylglucosamine--N-acetylmuramyl-(pentapeptide) pyrophosphoryl-undecaprenol N-acetylglucosamine transferase